MQQRGEIESKKRSKGKKIFAILGDGLDNLEDCKVRNVYLQIYRSRSRSGRGNKSKDSSLERQWRDTKPAER